MVSGTDGIVSDVARRISAQLPSLTPEMTGMFIDVIPEFRHDDAVQQLMIASTSSNLNVIADMLALNISLDDITVPPAAAEYARRFAQHDLSLEALLRAYRLGEHMFVQWAIHELDRLALSATESLASASRIAMQVNRYIDQVIEELIDIYGAERRHWDDRSDSARAAQVRTVLATDGLDVAPAEQMLGMSLRGWHLAVIAWTGTAAASGLQHVGRLLAAATGHTPVTMLADTQTLWAWVSATGRPTVDTDRLSRQLTEHPTMRIAIGEPATGLDGFRSSHREALRTRAVAEIDSHPRQLYQHSEVALAGLLVAQRNEVGAWATRVLGGLMRGDDTTARLRDTLRIFFDVNGSYTDAAARMHVHKNTVHYRVRKAEEILGRPLNENRLNIEVALLACSQLGLVSSESGA